MPLVPGKIVKEFEVKGKKVSIRYPKWEYLGGLLKHINALVSEGALIGVQKKIDRKSEMEWLADVFKKIEKKDLVHLVVEIDGKLVGGSRVERKALDTEKHKASFGISVGKECRGMGIGTILARTIIEEARKEMKIKLVESKYYHCNKASEKLHKRCGFKMAGRIPKGCKIKGRYCDEIIMIKEV